MDLEFKNILYTKVGTGPHLCFLHGFCENKTIWDELILSLLDSYTCISIDLPAFGKSVKSSFESIEQVATQINELLKHESAEETILFGHSLGGYILADYIGQFGNELRAAAFIHSSAGADSDQKKINRQKSIEFITKNGTTEFFRLFIPGIVAVENLRTCREQITEMVLNTRRSSVIAGLKAMKQRVSNVNQLSTFKKPVLWLKGDEDSFYTNDEIFNQAAQCSISQVSLLKNVGHLSMLEDKKKCLTEVRHFLNFVDRIKV